VTPPRFSPGDRVHLVGVGTGVVREVRSAGRCLVEIKGRAMLVAAAHLAPADGTRRTAGGPAGRQAPGASDPGPGAASLSLDLHGKTVPEALEALDAFLNDAILVGHRTVEVIHGRSGGRVKAAVHGRLAALPPVRSYRLDPRNPGATIVLL
jgi:dsDNA-specific endonuclease/ATPase MutS2